MHEPDLGNFNMKVDLKKFECEGVNQIHLAEDMIQWWASLMNVMNIQGS